MEEIFLKRLRDGGGRGEGKARDDKGQETRQSPRESTAFQEQECLRLLSAWMLERAHQSLRFAIWGAHTPSGALALKVSSPQVYMLSVLRVHPGIQGPLKSRFASEIKIIRDSVGKGTPIGAILPTSATCINVW